MEDFNRTEHWEKIYATKALTDVSWYQPVPETSLKFIADSNLPKSAKIIDVGGGDSFLVDHLIEAGYTDITVLDISEEAITRAKARLGEKAAKIKWIVADITAFSPDEMYDFWHDRAAFHFLAEEKDIRNYINLLSKAIKSGGNLMIGTFSEQGPTKCSGIEIKQYSEGSLTEIVGDNFAKNNCLTIDHKTPFDTTQNFIFCTFTRY